MPFFYFYPRPPRGGRHHTYYQMYKGYKISIHALREEGDTPKRSTGWTTDIFLSTPSARRATICASTIFTNMENFYPRPPRGGRPLFLRSKSLARQFLSTPSARRATELDCNQLNTKEFLSTPSARRATKFDESTGLFENISIHALREEGDIPHLSSFVNRFFISIHALREEGDGRSSTRICSNTLFLSTPSARRATCNSARVSGASVFLSTPSARRATRCTMSEKATHRISIHALREEGDFGIPTGIANLQVFLSTPSARRATGIKIRQNAQEKISIHALREEGDAQTVGQLAEAGNFYPRPPRGGRPSKSPDASTIEDISIHALREEGDQAKSTKEA